MKRPHHKIIDPIELESLSELPEYKVIDYDKQKAEYDILKDHHEDQFNNAKIMEFDNTNLRRKIAKNMLSLKKELNNVMNYRDRINK